MSFHLLFLFVFQGAIAFAFTYVIARVLLGGIDGEARRGMLKGMARIRLLILVCALILPAAMFAAYFKSLPEGQPTSVALLPAIWILLILLALLGALSLAMWQKPMSRHKP